MSALVQSKAFDLHKVNLLKDQSPGALATSSICNPHKEIPSTAEQDHSWPSGKRASHSSQVVQGKQQNMVGNC